MKRFLPNTRETAEETKRRAWSQYGILVVDIEKVPATWDVKMLLRQLGENLYGPRRDAR